MDNLFFIASKVAWAFLSPGNLIAFALIVGTLLLLFKRYKGAKLFLIPSALFAFILTIYPVQDYLIQPLENRFHKPEKLPFGVDGIIVLGGGEDIKRSLSWKVAEMGRGGDRYVGAAQLARIYPQIPVIFTGGSGSLSLRGIKGESTIAQTLLTSMGVHPKRLVLESKSRNTYENFVYTKPLLPKADGTYLLVTSAFHMPRAVGIAREQNINVIPYPVDYYSSSENLRMFGFEFSGNLSNLEIAWKEWIGLTAYYLTDKTREWFPSPENTKKTNTE